jgi:heat shock protein HslJ
MSADDLDDRIRALVRDAVAAAPPPPALPSYIAASSGGSTKTWGRVLAGVGIAAAVVAVVVVQLTEGGGATIGTTTTDAPTTTTVDSSPLLDQLRGHTWVLTGAAADVTINPSRPYLVFGGEALPLTTGFDGCNGFSQEGAIEDGALAITGGGSTSALCPGFTSLMPRAGDRPVVSADGSELSLVADASSQPRLTYRRIDRLGTASADLVGSWRVGDERLELQEDRTVVFGDCSGVWAVDGTTLRITVDVAPSGSPCAAGVINGNLVGVDLTALADGESLWLVDDPRAVRLEREESPVDPDPVTDGEPFPPCLTVTPSGQADVAMDSLRINEFGEPPIEEEQVIVSGRPATLLTFRGGFGVRLGQPDWCATFGATTTSMTRGAFIDWVAGLTVTETLPANMPPVLVTSTEGLSIVSSSGTRTVARGSIDQAVMLADGSVVYDSTDLADFQRWSPDTGTSEPIWAAVDFAATPVLHDAYRDTFIYSVNDRLFADDGSPLDPIVMPAAPGQRLSITTDGQIAGGPSPTAIDPNGSLQASVGGDSVISAVRTDDASVAFRSVSNRSFRIVSLDVKDGWVATVEESYGDALPYVRVIELATGRTLIMNSFFGLITGVHLG